MPSTHDIAPPTTDRDTAVPDYTCVLCGQPVLREGSECFDCRKSRPTHLRCTARGASDSSRTIPKLAVFGALALVAGGFASLSGFGEPTAIWSTRIRAAVTRIATVTGNCVLAGDADGRVIAFDEATGAERWRYTGAAPPVRALTIRGGSAYVTAGDGIHALDLQTGTVRWRRNTEAPPTAPALTSTMLVHCVGSTLEAVDLASGGHLWTYRLSDSRRPTGVTVHGKTAFFGFTLGEDGGLAALDIETRIPEWRQDLDCRIEHAPIPVADTVCAFGARNDRGRMIGVARSTGELLWRRDGACTPPAQRAGTLFLAERHGPDTRLVALTAANGTLLWETDSPTSTTCRPILGPRSVYYVVGDAVRAVRTQTGRERWSASIGEPLQPVVEVSGTTVYVATSSGHLLALAALIR